MIAAGEGNNKLRGVNLGGWLVLERWMCPEVFSGTNVENEYELALTSQGQGAIKKHHAEFIVEEDFQWLSQNGLNAVRIPVGYWIFGDEPPFVGSIEHLDRAFSYGNKYGITILISLHGAPGSQNAQHHSGVPTRTARWFHSEAFREQTHDVLTKLVERYENHTALWGIELMNEPQPGPLKLIILRRFYRTVFRHLSERTRVVFSDAFMPRFMNGVLGQSAYMDIHWYHFAFLPERFTPLGFYYAFLQHRTKLLKRFRKKQPVLVGEWSIVLSTLTLRRYPKETHEAMMDEHGKRQLAVYEGADGWFYWSYKTTGRGTWNFRSLVEDGRLLVP